MSALLESPPRALTFADLAKFSQQLADDVGRLAPRTEGFSVADYFTLDGNYLVEYRDGCLQVLPMPNAFHQALVSVAARWTEDWLEPDPLARVKFAPFRVRVDGPHFREPDVCAMLGRNAARRHETHWDGADLVIEVVSESNRDHDTVTKRAEYAAAGVPEYWIIDPDPRTITVLTLRDGAYAEVGTFGVGRVATSVLLAGFAIDVGDLFATAERKA